jgi:hypothetical protein
MKERAELVTSRGRGELEQRADAIGDRRHLGAVTMKTDEVDRIESEVALLALELEVVLAAQSEDLAQLGEIPLEGGMASANIILVERTSLDRSEGMGNLALEVAGAVAHTERKAAIAEQAISCSESKVGQRSLTHGRLMIARLEVKLDEELHSLEDGGDLRNRGQGEVVRLSHGIHTGEVGAHPKGLIGRRGMGLGGHGEGRNPGTLARLDDSKPEEACDLLLDKRGLGGRQRASLGVERHSIGLDAELKRVNMSWLSIDVPKGIRELGRDGERFSSLLRREIGPNVA